MALKKKLKPYEESISSKPITLNNDIKTSKLLFKVIIAAGIDVNQIFFYSTSNKSFKAMSLFLFILFESNSSMGYIKNIFSFYGLKLTNNEVSKFLRFGYFCTKSDEDFNKLVNEAVNEFSTLNYSISKNLNMENSVNGIINEVIKDFPNSSAEEISNYLSKSSFNIKIDPDAIAVRMNNIKKQKNE